MVGGEKHECPRKKGRDFIYLCAVRSQRRARGDARLAQLFHDAFGSRDGAPWQRSPRSPPSRVKPHAHNLRLYRHIGQPSGGLFVPNVFHCRSLDSFCLSLLYAIHQYQRAVVSLERRRRRHSASIDSG